MISSKAAWKRASVVAKKTFDNNFNGSKRTLVGGTTHQLPGAPKEKVVGTGGQKPEDWKTRLATIPHAQKAKRTQDKEFFVNLLEASVTKRDAKSYLKTFTPKTKPKAAPFPKAQDQGQANNATPFSQPRATPPAAVIDERPNFLNLPKWKDEPISAENPPHVALVKLRDPQSIDDETLQGIAKTLSQLQRLGMLSVVVVECETDGPGWKAMALKEATRVATTIDDYGGDGARLVESAIAVSAQHHVGELPLVSGNVFVEDEELIMAPMRLGELPILPSIAYTADTHAAKQIPSNDVLLALTKSFSGLQYSEERKDRMHDSVEGRRQPKTALVDRIIVLDPLGGIPASHRPNGCHVFVNLEQEFKPIKAALEDGSTDHRCQVGNLDEVTKLSAETSHKHVENLELAKLSLAMLPRTASAVITTPEDAANLVDGEFEIDETLTGPVGTRRRQNPLIHNLLTDKPVYSSSLPLGRIKGGTSAPGPTLTRPPLTTFAKRGMPLTLFPDPKASPWRPSPPGSASVRLTDTCIDLPRLVHLINDSFDRKLDVEHYLKRVDGSMAGVIIAGEYEGGAILTWEVPAGLTYAEAYSSKRLVPYLDKFAVLKRSQGSGGVADIVFSSMVRECFPGGVCWRSRKDNVVNKWYSERSMGTYKIPGANWTMFWTTPALAMEKRRFWDYESVCRGIEPSWADVKPGGVVD